MGTASLHLSHHPAGFLTLLGSELRLLLRRYWWELILYSLTIFLVWAWFGVFHLRLMAEATILYSAESPWLGYSLWTILLGVIPAAWGLRIWWGEFPGCRSTGWSRPVSRPVFHLSRVSAGAVIYWIVIIAGYYLTVTFLTLVSNVDTQGGSMWLLSFPWLVGFLGYFNWYLAATLAALTSDRPAFWLLIGLLIGVILYAVQVLLILPGSFTAAILGWTILPPHGLIAGLGLSLAEMERASAVPASWAPVIWFAILSAAVGLAATRHRDA